MPKQLKIIVIGSSHANFTLYPVLNKIFNQLCSQRVPCAYMKEGPSDETLITEIESTMRGLQQNQIIKKIAPEIIQYYEKDKQSMRFYLPKSAWAPLEKIVKEKFMPFLDKAQQNQGVLKQIVLELYRENAYIEEIKLYNELKNLQVHFSGLDAVTSIYNEQLIASSSNNEAYRHNEPIRISTMVSNFYQHITEKFSNGGIILVSTGTNHAQRLAANLLHHARTAKLDLDISLNLFKLRSSYELEWEADHEYALHLTGTQDSSEIKEIYKSLPCTNIEAKNDRDEYSIPELESIVNELAGQSTQSPHLRSSLFSPLLPHDQLVNDIKACLRKTSEKISPTFMNTIEEKKNYSLALRNACAWGNCELVKLLISYSKALPIDFNSTSSNGNTPLAWFEASKASSGDKKEIISMLKSRMEIPSQSHNKPS